MHWLISHKPASEGQNFSRVCRRLRSAQNRVKILFRPMLTFAYAGPRFVSERKRISKSARDDVSCDNSRAERVVRIPCLFVTIRDGRKQRIRPEVGDVSMCFACKARQAPLSMRGASAHVSHRAATAARRGASLTADETTRPPSRLATPSPVPSHSITYSRP
jgi:hypothetical protein